MGLADPEFQDWLIAKSGEPPGVALRRGRGAALNFGEQAVFQASSLASSFRCRTTRATIFLAISRVFFSQDAAGLAKA
jgi:hypothetical protein